MLDLGDPEAETAEVVAQRIRAALAHVPAERLIPAPDCGMKYLPRALAFAKLRALSEGAALVRRRAVSARWARGVARVETLWKRFANAPMTAFWCVANRGPRTTSKQRRSTRFADHQPKAVTQDS